MVTLDQKSFKALASPTRLSILRELRKKNCTVTELAKSLGKSKPTVSEHVKALSRAQLIQHIDSGHKWKYYALSTRGVDLFDEKKTFRVELLVAILGGVGTISSLATYFMNSMPPVAEVMRAPSAGVAEAMADLAVTETSAVSVGSATSAWPAVLACIFALITLLALLQMRRQKTYQKQAFK